MGGVKQFFNKIGEGAKKFFGKNGTLEQTFKKGGTAEKFINKVGAGIDTGLKAVGNVASKVGNIAGDLAPALMAVNPELGALALGAGKLAGQAGAGVRKIQDVKKTAVNAFHKPMNQVGNAIMATKPEPQEDAISVSSMFA